MLIQLDWLKDYVNFAKTSAEDLGHALTMGGLEVESLEWVELPEGEKTRVLELNVTPNRGYCLSYIGVAREVAAILGKKLHLPSPNAPLEEAWGPDPVAERIIVENHEPTLCPRYSALVIENVTPGSSPKWLLDRLVSMGLRPINNIVDITNYVMLETGQPLHAFDRELLAGPKIVVRRARKNEPFLSLDGTDLKLDEDALVIADAEKPVALAGIMGGIASQVSLSTRNLVLESACFDPVTVRKGSKKYNLRSDSSFRFERGVDIDGVITAQSRAALLIQELAGGKICRGRVESYPSPFPLNAITLRVSRVNKILGVQMPAKKIKNYMERLGLKVDEKNRQGEFQVEVPSFRPTLSREIDLIEEIVRLEGYDQVDASHPSAVIIPVRVSEKRAAIQKAQETLSRLGYSEAINYSFIDAENAEKFITAFGAHDSVPIPLSNPLSEDWATMRTSLIPGLIRTAVRNLSKGQKPVRIFEVGSLFFRDGSGRSIRNKPALAGLSIGPYECSVWKNTGKDYDFYDLKGALEAVMAGFRLSIECRSAQKSFLFPGKSVECFVDGTLVGFMGELSAEVSRACELSPGGYVFELDLEALISRIPGPTKFQPIPKYPETYRDISILVDRSVQSKIVTDLIAESSAPLLSRVELYDHFEGEKIQEGKKSLTYSLTFQSSEKTLTDEEVNPVFDNIVKTLAEKLGATLRD